MAKFRASRARLCCFLGLFDSLLFPFDTTFGRPDALADKLFSCLVLCLRECLLDGRVHVVLFAQRGEHLLEFGDSGSGCLDNLIWRHWNALFRSCN